MAKNFTLLLVFILMIGCQNTQKEMPRKLIDSISYDPELDSKDFTRCNSEELTIQYFNNSKGLEYQGDKPAIVEEFRKAYVPPINSEEDGLIRIRFIVNCKGEVGRLRLISMDKHYNEKEFPKNITSQLLQITNGLKGWKPKELKGELRDYYQYLIFKIKKGNIIKILP